LHLVEVMHTAMSKPNAICRLLVKDLVAGLDDNISFTTKKGDLTLNEYVLHPNHRVQAVVMVHRGRIVCKAYLGMNQNDMRFIFL
jgi:hypothetical protein